MTAQNRFWQSLIQSEAQLQLLQAGFSKKGYRDAAAMGRQTWNFKEDLHEILLPISGRGSSIDFTLEAKSMKTLRLGE
jgi:hypothetical protein